MYWASGRKILEAARLAGVRPNLHLVYISNFKCGPDSYIKHFTRAGRGRTAAGVAVRRARQRRRLHDALRSVPRQQRDFAMLSLLTERPQSQSADGLVALKGKTIYIPPMAHGSARTFAAGFRALGLDARITPPSDDRTLELGGRYTSGDECYPAKVTDRRLPEGVGSARDRPRQGSLLPPYRRGPLPVRAVCRVPARGARRQWLSGNRDSFADQQRFLRRAGAGIRTDKLAHAGVRGSSAEADVAGAPARSPSRAR